MPPAASAVGVDVLVDCRSASVATGVETVFPMKVKSLPMVRAR